MSDASKLAARLGGAVAAARKERGLSQEVLAERIGVSKNFIGLVERGQSFPSVPLLADLSTVLGLSLDRVLLEEAVPAERWTSKTAALLDAVAPEFRDLAVGYLRSLAAMRPTVTRPKRKRQQLRRGAP